MNILIIGGAGFIGSNVAKYFCQTDHHVTIYDNLSRTKTEHNLQNLQKKNKDKLNFIQGDIRTPHELPELIEQTDAIIHLAAQVAVTTSVLQPRLDFNINLLGTFNILEALRQSHKKPPLIYSSTNKVYGSLPNIPITEHATRYSFPEHPFGISEKEPLDFHSPYGCSKGAADQYVHDYARIFGLKTVVLRQSCIYGQHQYGCEDQGWLAWFAIAATQNKPITIYGNGKQTRDVLYIDDLCTAFEATLMNIDKTTGEVYNIGGGSNNTLSLLELLELLEQKIGKKISIHYDQTRHGDQPIYISDIRKAQHHFGWMPKTIPQEGVQKLINWVRSEHT